MKEDFEEEIKKGYAMVLDCPNIYCGKDMAFLTTYKWEQANFPICPHCNYQICHKEYDEMLRKKNKGS